MPSLRFANPKLQARFLASLKQLPFELQIADGSSVVCTEEQWPMVNDVAHKVRNACFKWYFSWCNSEASFSTGSRSHLLHVHRARNARELS